MVISLHILIKTKDVKEMRKYKIAADMALSLHSRYAFFMTGTQSSQSPFVVFG